MVDMEEKCELASELVDYIWYSVIHKNNLLVEHHSYEEKDDVRYLDEAQDIFNVVLDIIDEKIGDLR